MVVEVVVVKTKNIVRLRSISDLSDLDLSSTTARMPTICTFGREFCIWEELYIDNKDISAA